MRAWAAEKKWLMVQQDSQAEYLAAHNNHADPPNPMRSVLAEKADKVWSTLHAPHPTSNNNNKGSHAHSSSTNRLPSVLSSSTILTAPSISPSSSSATMTSLGSSSVSTPYHPAQQDIDDTSAPEYFIRKFMESNLRAVTLSEVAKLEVCLRTRPITWLVKFIDLKGLHVLISSLAIINRVIERANKKAMDIEAEIIKCIKALINTKLGGKDMLEHANYVQTVVFSILCPHWQTRKMVCEILTFYCYMTKDCVAYDQVIRGFELLKLHTKAMGNFDRWMSILEDTLNGRVYNAPDKHLMEYALSNLILINALTKVPANASGRIKMRQQLNASGWESRIVPKLKVMHYPVLQAQLDAYQQASDQDLDDTFGDELSLYSHVNNPHQLLALITQHLEPSPKSMDALLSLLKNLLLIKGDATTMSHYMQMTNMLVGQVVMNRRLTSDREDLTAVYGVSVGNLIQQFSDLDRLKELEECTAQSQSTIIGLQNDNQELYAQIQQLKHQQPSDTHLNRRRKLCSLDLKKENESLRSLLKTSKNTMFMLERRVSELTDMMENSDPHQPTVAPAFLQAQAQSTRIIVGSEWKTAAFGSQQSTPADPRDTTVRPSAIKNADVPVIVLKPPTHRKTSYLPHTSRKPSTVPTSTILPMASASTPRKTLHVQPQVKLKNLQWQKLDHKTVDKTVWSAGGVDEQKLESKLSQIGIFDRIDTMFTAKSNTAFDKKLRAKAEEKKNVVKFLVKNKSHNLHIAVLPKLKRYGSFDDVREEMMRLNDSLFTETLLTNLLANAPSKEDDQKTLNKYLAPDAAVQDLDVPEQLTIEMMKLYRYKERLQFMLFRVHFWEKFDQLMENMTTIVNASDALHDSQAFKELLSIVLMMGNYMNGTGLQGGAFGIRISSLNKLVDTRASDTSSLTLLHVLIGMVRREFPQVLSFLDDLKDMGQAARIMASVNDIIQEYTDMRQTLKQLEKELQDHWQGKDNLDAEDLFLEVMQEHHKAATDRFDDLETLYLNMDAKWKNTMVFYGENPKVMRPDDFFSVFHQFTTQWKVAANTEKKYSDRLEEEEKQHEEDEESLGPKTPAEDAQTGENERSVMDNLLDRLRSGESLHQKRRVRHQRYRRQQSTPLPCVSTSTTSSSSDSTQSPMDPHDTQPLSAEDLLKRLQNDFM
ncbi:actin-binding FH2 [Hesseltinella vesiculosa]|uniref:Actin-binding FH2 n=1 Tax=Hesseltinella vesiculosa TaxID=101127 RepID=A0A1X2G761_9FUNG|nr:actin-binding FH2 [Hesseltinella vesiculosa]